MNQAVRYGLASIAHPTLPGKIESVCSLLSHKERSLLKLAHIARKVATQVDLNLAEVGRSALALPIVKTG